MGASIWPALWLSRLVVLVVGVLAAATLGFSERAPSFDPQGFTAGHGGAGDALAGPFARWDSVWFLTIAQDGYELSGARPAFFPLYPLMVRVFGTLTGSLIVGGVIVSLTCFVLALVLLHKLATLELGRERAGTAVLLCALAPMGFFFSAVYSESLFLATSLGAIYFARLGRWELAGVAGALAAATRSTGVLLVIPILLLALYGPRADRDDADRPDGRRWLPRHGIGVSELTGVVLVPLGLLAFVLYLGVTTGNSFGPFRAQDVWGREFAGPFGAIPDAAVAAWAGVRQLLSGSTSPVYFELAGGDPLRVASTNVMLFAFLIAGLIALAGALRRLPLAYGGYAVVSLAVPLSYPVEPQPLMSLPRFMLVMFPLVMWLAIWVHDGSRLRRTLTIATSTALLAVFTSLFATWHWVA